jgi:hypothetical protein
MGPNPAGTPQRHDAPSRAENSPVLTTPRRVRRRTFPSPDVAIEALADDFVMLTTDEAARALWRSSDTTKSFAAWQAAGEALRLNRARGHNQWRLREEILALSEADDWLDARKEWTLIDVFFEHDQSCLCSHTPITENCVIANGLNGNTTVVGNVCIHQFMGMPSHRIFDCLKRIGADLDKALNHDTIDHFHGQGILSWEERDFALDTMRKRKLSPEEMARRHAINQRVLENAHYEVV